ncbi:MULTISPECIES: hypothetical protein [Methylobacterium]|jgi:hypothetical protein|uniref:Uncharacterized protein n=2 Tax=Methylobacterium TaxID=407 RepID=A0A0C6FRQ1_9HYPH|nr:MULTISPECIES: hypothetical protein [Methylobacterium]MBZ6411482.1 hypothetical protein [Methylobacterium sp.]MBK3396371.1 hypothetical protein [Methylobacterium ajmalii]MBK3410365.1 hypothetical protein [Methylobacterium ajmalii]MBK3425658.1 hypothetical protein [Methylobacterium ajmalii]SFE61097.1 hypothetical protein SAMN04487844_104197 [Methylobacterium sp. yr596]
MRPGVKRLYLWSAAAALLAGGISAAEAGCLRRVVNRSPYFAVASRNGGPSVGIPPHSSRAIRMLAPGRVDIAAHCAARGPRGRLVPVGPPVAQDSYTFTAVLDRCYYDLGLMGFGQGGTEPFVLNTPQQGDLTVGPFASACPPR